MATVELITLTDSLDERIKNGVETVTFFHPVFGTKHEIELSEKNREHFAAHLAKLDKYIDASREVTPEPVKTAAKAGPKSDLSKVREWAKANGFEVGDRGRIKAEILEAYDKAQMPASQTNPDCPEGKVGCEVLHETSDEQPVKLAEVSTEAPEAEQHVLTDAEILALMDKVDESGAELTVDKLAEAAKV